MSLVSTPSTVRLSGALTVAPTLPIAGGTESAVQVDEALSAKSVSEQVFTLAASGSQTLFTTTLLNSNAALVFVQSTGSVTISSGSALLATGTFIVVSRTNNAYPGGILVVNDSSTSPVTVRVVLAALS